MSPAAGLRGYGYVLTHGPAVRPFAAAVVGRLPIGMTSLGMVLLIESVRGAYASAGIVTGAFALATAVGAAIWGRMMDQHGQPRVLVPTALGSGLAIAGVAIAAVLGASDLVLIMFAAVAGVLFPAVSPAMRAAWRVIFTDARARQLGYALDASAVEMIFVLGPLLLSLLASVFPPAVPLLTSATLLIVGTLLYSSTTAARSVRGMQREDEHAPAPPVPDMASVVEGEHLDRGPRTALAAPGIALVLLVAMLMAVGFGQMDTALVATAEHVLGSTKQLGILFMFIAGGSAIGGITYGSRDWPGTDAGRLVVLLSTFALTLLPWPFLLRIDHPPLPLLFGLLFVTGLTIAPSLIIFQNLLDILAPRDRMMEAQSLLSASQTTGAALGTAVAGFTIDAWAAPGGIVGGFLAIASSAAAAVLVYRQAARAA